MASSPSPSPSPSPSLPTSPASGLFAGRYTIECVIGRGATATVHLARDPERGIAVAIKILRSELAESSAVAGFLREIRRTSGLQHPHILAVLDSGESAGLPYIVLPYMEGGSLRQLLKRERALELPRVALITRTIAGALDYAHKHGLIHRDVKPENILFTDGQACLGDFGIARAIESVYGDAPRSSGIIRGTYSYMSPEQAAGAEDLDGRSDIYSLACVVYEMITGVRAFIGPQRDVRPSKVRAHRPTAPASIDRALAKAFAVRPADRYRTAVELAERLEATLASNS